MAGPLLNRFRIPGGKQAERLLEADGFRRAGIKTRLRRLQGWPTIDTDERCPDHRLFRRREDQIAAVLARRGLAAIDADDDPLLARSVDAAGNVVEEPEEPGLCLAFPAQLGMESGSPGRTDPGRSTSDAVRLWRCGQRARAGRPLHSRVPAGDRRAHDAGTTGCAPKQRLGPYRGHSRVPTPHAAGIAGPLARIRGDPHRRQAAPRRRGGRDSLPHAGCSAASRASKPRLGSHARRCYPRLRAG